MKMQFLARFDRRVLRPPGPLSHPGEWRAPPREAQSLWQALRQWCFAGTGAEDEAANASARLAIAILQGGAAEARAPLLESLSQDLDGSVRMAACEGAIARLRLRLGVKLVESVPWRARRATDPWDCGYLDDHAESLGALPRFRPRRTTLMIANRLKTASLMNCVESLAQARHAFHHPVRLLVDLAQGEEGPELHASIGRTAQGVPVALIPFELEPRA